MILRGWTWESACRMVVRMAWPLESRPRTRPLKAAPHASPTASGTRRIRCGPGSTFTARLLSFAAALGCVACLIVWIDTSIWREQARLEKSFAAIKTEKFYFGVNFRVALRKVNASLLDYALSGDAADLDAFWHDANELKRWLAATSSAATDARERKRVAQLENGYREFLKRLSPLLQTNAPPAVPQLPFAAAYVQVRQASKPLLELCSEVVESDRRGFDQFLRESDGDLRVLQQLFLVSLGLLVALAGSLALLVYRGMLAPLRAQLHESQAVVERQEKLASLGALAAGLAHEIRNPLTAIKFRLFSLRKSLPLDLTEHEDARVISEEISRLDGTLNGFLQFARPAGPTLARIRADAIFRTVLDLQQSELESRGIELRCHLAEPVWVHADLAQMKQVIINLVHNSADSILRHGTITLELSRTTAELRGSVRRAAVLAVIDTGSGIPPEVQKRLFDPFFSTKDGGTGLGLALAARIVDAHGGVIRYRTELNQGTVFEVVLPRLEDHGTHDPAD